MISNCSCPGQGLMNLLASPRIIVSRSMFLYKTWHTNVFSELRHSSMQASTQPFISAIRACLSFSFRPKQANISASGNDNSAYVKAMNNVPIVSHLVLQPANGSIHSIAPSKPSSLTGREALRKIKWATHRISALLRSFPKVDHSSSKQNLTLVCD
jgi:hypothetical protein